MSSDESGNTAERSDTPEKVQWGPFQTYSKEKGTNNESSSDKTRARSFSLSSGHSIMTALRLPGHKGQEPATESKNHTSHSSSASGIFRKIWGEKESVDDPDDVIPDTGSWIGRRRSSSSRDAITPVQSNESMETEVRLLKSENGNIKISTVFIEDGLSLLKVSHKSKKRVLFQINPSTLTFIWRVSNKSSIQPNVSATGIDKLLLSAQSHSIYPNKDKTNVFSIDDIRKVLYQEEARFYRDELNISRDFESQWISIAYFDNDKNKQKTLHLIADTEKDFKKFRHTLENLRRLRFELSEKLYIDLDNMNDKQKELIHVSTSNSIASSTNNKRNKEHLSFENIVKYTNRLNLNIGKNNLRQIFDSLDCKTVVEGEPVLNFDEFKGFIASLKRRSDIEDLWASVIKEDDHNRAAVLHFLEDVQKEDLKGDLTFEKVYMKFANDDGCWTAESLNQFLLSKYSKPIDQQVLEDEYYSRPLNEYFISSSHNTYLTGKQIADVSSSEGYVRALQKGCRCVEIDIWDGTDPVTGGQIPIVCHGKTFTSSITLQNVLHTIRKYAFVSTEFPLILSLEINCSPACQLEVVSLLKDIMAGYLVIDYPNPTDVLPPPIELKHKILIKAKKTTSYENLIVTESGTFVSSSNTSTSVSEDSFNSQETIPTSRRKRRRHVINQLSDMAVYVQGLRFRNFSLPESKTFNHCFSLNEKVIAAMLKDPDKVRAVDKHNRKFLMRVYPSNLRFKSSNFLPLQYWTHGVQFVATNWQTYDLGQQMNEALFDGPNNSGFYLKPPDLRQPLSKHTMKASNNVKRLISFEFLIVSGHQLPKPKHKEASSTNPFVKVEILGTETKTTDEEAKFTTSVIHDNGFNPTWGEKFSGKITSGELVFVKFSVNSTISKDDDTVLGVFVAKLSNLKKGYRYLPLRDSLGEELIYSSLFVKIDY